MTNPEFLAAFEFANRYAGYHAAPAHSPIAWCALRGGKPRPRGNFWWFLEQIDPDETSVALASNRGQKMIGPDDQRFGRFARRTDVVSGKRRLFFRLDPQFRASIRKQPCQVHVCYLDEGQGEWSLRWRPRPDDRRTVQNGGSGRWKELTVDLPGAAFKGGLDRAADLVLAAESKDDIVFHMVQVVRTTGSNR